MPQAIQHLPIDDLIPYAANPRKNEEAVAAVAASIRQFGFVGAIIVNREGLILCGHTRVKAMRQLGETTIPAIVVDRLTPEQERALRIADNKTAEIAEWNEELLKAELLALQEAGFALDALGFDSSELDDLLSGEADAVGQTPPDDVPETPDSPLSIPGEVYVLGQHRLLCGDATDAAAVAQFCPGGSADLLLTDPPYNVDYHCSDGQTIANDALPDAAFRDFLRRAFRAAEAALKPGGAFYVFHADSEGENFRAACRESGLRVRQCLIWAKNALVLGRQDYQWRHEPCLYGWKEGASHAWLGGRQQTTLLEYDKPRRADLHPTMKPVEMLAQLIRNSSARGETVLDPFGGSGSTLIACEQTGRACRTIELSPKFCDTIRRRWAEFAHGKFCDWQALTPPEEARHGD